MKALLAVTRNLNKWMIAKDTIAMDTILATDFTLTHITGYVQPKAEWYAAILSEDMKYYGYQEINTTATIDGTKATLVSQNVLDARIWGSRAAWLIQQTMVLEKRNDQWVILKSVATSF